MRKSKIWKYSKDELIELVTSSQSLTDLIIKVGLKGNAGGNAQTVKNCLDYYHIDWTKLVHNGVHNRAADYSSRRLDDTKLFIKNSPHKRCTVKRHILQQNLLPYKCAICGQNPVWNGKPMVLILDHINGVSNDHRLNNLRFVCPNCNSQLDTHCGKNKLG